MAILSATCATLASVIAAAQPGDIVRLPRQPQRCGYVRLHNLDKPPPGVRVEIARNQRIGLHVTASRGLHFSGGIFEGAGPTRPADPASPGVGIYLRGSREVSFRNGRFGTVLPHVWQGAVIGEVTDLVIRDSVFGRYRADGIQMANVERVRITGNVFDGSDVLNDRCEYPGGRIEQPTKDRNACAAAGGTWKPSTHPDGIQMFRTIRDVLISRNRVTGRQQGIGIHGPPGEGWERLWMIDNLVESVHYYNGLANHAVDGLGRGNDLAGGQIFRGTALYCENRHRRSPAPVWPAGPDPKRPCPATLPQAPAPPRGIPGVRTNAAGLDDEPALD